MATKDGIKRAYEGDLWFYVTLLDLSAFEQHPDPQHGEVYTKESEFMTWHWTLTEDFNEAMFFKTKEEAAETVKVQFDLTKFRAVIRSVHVKVNGFDVGEIVR